MSELTMLFFLFFAGASVAFFLPAYFLKPTRRALAATFLAWIGMMYLLSWSFANGVESVKQKAFKQGQQSVAIPLY